jgi:hypothetical protein
MAIACGIMAEQRSVAGGVLPSSKHQLQKFPILVKVVIAIASFLKLKFRLAPNPRIPTKPPHRSHQPRGGEGLYPGLAVRYIKSFNSPPGQIRKRGGFKHRNRFFPVPFPLLSQQIFWHFRGRLKYI